MNRVLVFAVGLLMVGLLMASAAVASCRGHHFPQVDVHAEEDLSGTVQERDKETLTVDHCGGDVCRVTFPGGHGWVLAAEYQAAG